MATTEEKVQTVSAAFYEAFGTDYGTPFAGHLAGLCTELAKIAVDVLES